MQTRNRIVQGYTRKGYIAPREGIHEGLEFTYEPMLPQTVSRLDDAIEKEQGEKQALVIARELARHMKEWSEIDENGKPVPIDTENVRRLPFILHNTLHQIMAGILASDTPTNQPMHCSDDDDIQSLLEGEPPGIAAVETERKN
jgi:hypothetical protein